MHPMIQPRRARSRRGAMLPLVALLLTVVIVALVFTVDVAYMQLVDAELRSATDAAAKAGTEALSRLQNQNQAVQAAVDVAALNRVAGRPLRLQNSDVTVGNSTQNSSGVWTFTAGMNPLNSVRIDAQMLAGNTNGSVALLFGGLLGMSSFSPRQTAIATNVEQDVCLVIDRSHSMCFDHSGVNWEYPPSIPEYPKSLKRAPHNSQSRWAALESGVNTYCTAVGSVAVPPRVALVTFGSEITLSSYEGNYTKRTFPAVATDSSFVTDYTPARTAITGRGDDIMLGGTNLSAGMDRATVLLTGSSARPFSEKIMIVMTDGQWNQGRDPSLSATDAKAAGITIHTVTFLSGADQSDMIAVAAIGGGKHIHADTATELEEAFRTLAATLPVVLTQ